MANKPSAGTSDVRRSLKLETDAAQALLRSLGTLANEDEDIKITAIEGETNLFEALDVGLVQYHEDCALAKAIKEQEERLAGRRKRLEARAENIKTALLAALTAAGIPKLARPAATLTVAQKPRQLVVHKETEIPPRYWTTPAPSPDKRAILADLRAGIEVDGCGLDNGGEGLQIRTT